MTRPTLPLAIALLGATINLAAASPQQYDQEAQARRAQCNNDCLHQAWPEGYCVNDSGCHCTDQAKREKWLCCIAERCDQTTLTDAIAGSLADCKVRNLSYDFDPEAVCGVKLTTSISPTAPIRPTDATTDGGISPTPAASGAISPTGSGTSIKPTQTGAGGAAQTSDPAGNGASNMKQGRGKGAVVFGASVLGAVAGWMLLL